MLFAEVRSHRSFASARSEGVANLARVVLEDQERLPGSLRLVDLNPAIGGNRVARDPNVLKDPAHVIEIQGPIPKL
jgi:hypothetical protein